MLRGVLAAPAAASRRLASHRTLSVALAVQVPAPRGLALLASRRGLELQVLVPTRLWSRRNATLAGDKSSDKRKSRPGSAHPSVGAIGTTSVSTASSPAREEAVKDDGDEDEPFLTKIVEPTYPAPKPRTDINKVYFPGKAFRSTSKDVVFRAMAGNTAITILKLGAWFKTGSSAMMSEAIHSLVDTGNQALLILGLRQAAGVPDKKHQYGYGRAAYFWSLISALGIFWLGAGVTITHGIQSILDPPKELTLSWEVWTVLGCSFMIDGWVLKRSVEDLLATKPKGMSFFQHVKRTKDPFMMAVLLEDSSACTGVIMAACGIGATHVTGNPLWDSLASISIGVLLGSVAVTLIRLNQKFLLGQSVEPEIEQGIRELLLSRPSIDNVYAVQSQWVGPSTFSYKVRWRRAHPSWSLPLTVSSLSFVCVDRPRSTLTALTWLPSCCKCANHHLCQR